MQILFVHLIIDQDSYNIIWYIIFMSLMMENKKVFKYYWINYYSYASQKNLIKFLNKRLWQFTIILIISCLRKN